MKKKIAIIGGGASGLVCALIAAGQKNEITIIEKNKRAGRKILATGNGRCNITNVRINPSFYHGHHPSFVNYALRQFDNKEAERFFNGLGLEFVEIEDGRVFPMSLQASSVVDFLEDALIRKEVLFQTETEVHSISKEGGRFHVLHNKGKSYYDAVVIATGSEAMPSLGSADTGYRIARSFGHKIFSPFAVLVQLVSNDPFCSRASGVKLDAILRAVTGAQDEMALRGDLLFTNYGLSGLAILDISRNISYALSAGKETFVEIDLLPDIALSSLKNILRKKSTLFAQKAPVLWLNGILHKKVVIALLQKLGYENLKQLNVKQLQTLAYTIKHLKVAIRETRGVKGAEVMAGGVDCSEVDFKTMESKRCKGLFFTGEVLDIDGDRGGYNLHWAWASGYLAGKKLSLL